MSFLDELTKRWHCVQLLLERASAKASPSQGGPDGNNSFSRRYAAGGVAGLSLSGIVNKETLLFLLLLRPQPLR